jgi:hypothetical protein
MSPVTGSYEQGNEPSVPYRAGNILTNWTTISFSKERLLHGSNWIDEWMNAQIHR